MVNNRVAFFFGYPPGNKEYPFNLSSFNYPYESKYFLHTTIFFMGDFCMSS